MTPQTPSLLAVNETELAVHAPAPVDVKVTAPSPDPPDVVSVIALPTVPVSDVFVTDNLAWATGTMNVNVVGALVAAR